MTQFGRIVVTVLSAGVVIALTMVAAHFLKAPGGPADAPPPGPAEAAARVDATATPAPVVVETPVPGSPASSPSSKGASAPSGLRVLQPVGSAPGTAAPAASGAVAATTQPVAVASASGSVDGGPGAAIAQEGLAMMVDRPVEAQTRLSQALRAGVDGALGAKVREALVAMADRVQFSGQMLAGDPYSKSYAVARGDSLTSIGKRHLVPPELIMRLNRLAGSGIMAGQQLRVVQGPIHVEILKSRMEAQAWLGDVCVRTYRIGIGSANSTPDGTFVVRNKMKDPPYQPMHKARSEFRDSGAPDNPLGTRWIDIGNHYGMHGTIDPTSIGRDVSEGCIRMLNKDVEELYDMVVTGASKVIIRP